MSEISLNTRNEQRATELHTVHVHCPCSKIAKFNGTIESRNRLKSRKPKPMPSIVDTVRKARRLADCEALCSAIPPQ